MSPEPISGWRALRGVVRVESRGVLWLALGVLCTSLAATLMVAWLGARRGEIITLGSVEHEGLLWLTVLALIPILADLFAGADARSARGALSRLPASSASLSVARAWVAAFWGAVLYGGMLLGWGAAAVFLARTEGAAHVDAPPGGVMPGGFGGPWGLLAELWHTSFPVWPVMTIGATALLAVLVRSSLVATLLGLVAAALPAALAVGSGLVDRASPFAQALQEVAARGWALWLFGAVFLVALLLSIRWAGALRGSGNRSVWVRLFRTAAIFLGAYGVTYGSSTWGEYRAQHYAFDDPEARLAHHCWVTLDAESVVLTLEKRGVRTLWILELDALEARRAEGDPKLLEAAASWKERRDRWGALVPDGGPAGRLWPSRRGDRHGYYLDEGLRLHRVDFVTGEDRALDVVTSGHPLTVGIDGDGRWITWSVSGESFHAQNLVTGERVDQPFSSVEDTVYGLPGAPSLGGGPVLRRVAETGASHGTIVNGKVVPLALPRRYSFLHDVDGERLLGEGYDGGVYLIDSRGREQRIR